MKFPVKNPGVFGLGKCWSESGMLHCDVCKKDYNKDGIYTNIIFTQFIGITVCESCFGVVEQEVKKSMPQLLEWYDEVLLEEHRNRMVSFGTDLSFSLQKHPVANKDVLTITDTATCPLCEAEELEANSVKDISIEEEGFVLVTEENTIRVGDYIVGIEYVGEHNKPRKVYGWVDKTHYYGEADGWCYDIQCDDCYDGYRGSIVHGKEGIRKAIIPKLRPVLHM